MHHTTPDGAFGDEMERKLLRVTEVAEMLGIGRSKAYELVARGEIPSVWVAGRCRRVPREALDRWLEQLTEDHGLARSLLSNQE
jgi:excisionase family DNA binding protein